MCSQPGARAVEQKKKVGKGCAYVKVSSAQRAEHMEKWLLLSTANLFFGPCGVFFPSPSIFQ